MASGNLNHAVHADAGILHFDDFGIPVAKAWHESEVGGYGVKGEEVRVLRGKIDEAIVLTSTRFDYGIPRVRWTCAGLLGGKLLIKRFRQNKNRNNDSVTETDVRQSVLAVTCDHFMVFEHKIPLKLNQSFVSLRRATQ